MKTLDSRFLLLLFMMIGTGSMCGQTATSDGWSKYKIIAAISDLDHCYYAMNNTIFDNGAMGAEKVVILNGKAYCPESMKKSVVWIVGRLWKDNVFTGKVQIHTADGVYLSYKSGNSCGFGMGSATFDWALDEKGIKTSDSDVDYYIKLNETYSHFSMMKSGANYNCALLYNVASDSDGYVRSGLVSGKVGTICLDRAVDLASTAGAKFYSVVGKCVDSDGLPTKLVLGEESGELVAGRPYIFVADDTFLAVAYEDDAEVSAAGSYHGLHGVLDGTYTVDGSGNVYAITNNSLKKAGSGATIGANRAYIDMDEVPVVDSSAGVKGLVDFPLDEGYNGISSPSAVKHSSAVVPVTSHVYVRDGRKYLK